MNAKRYLRGMLGQGWYNFTECLAWAILYRKMPEELEYCHKVAYGPKKREWINTIVFARVSCPKPAPVDCP